MSHLPRKPHAAYHTPRHLARHKARAGTRPTGCASADPSTICGTIYRAWYKHIPNSSVIVCLRVDAGCTQVKVTGFGKQMGLQVVWELLIRQDGACLQHIKGKELSFCSGTEGSANPNAWEVPHSATLSLAFQPLSCLPHWDASQVDDTGVPHMLELDDNEVCQTQCPSKDYECMLSAMCSDLQR